MGINLKSNFMKLYLCVRENTQCRIQPRSNIPVDFMPENQEISATCLDAVALVPLE